MLPSAHSDDATLRLPRPRRRRLARGAAPAAGSRGRPGRECQRQKSRKASRCQRRSVAGWTIVSASRQAKHRASRTSATRVGASPGAPDTTPAVSGGRGSPPPAPSGSGAPSPRTSARPRQARAPPARDAGTLRSSAIVTPLLSSSRWIGCNANSLTALRVGAYHCSARADEVFAAQAVQKLGGGKGILGFCYHVATTLAKPGRTMGYDSLSQASFFYGDR